MKERPKITKKEIDWVLAIIRQHTLSNPIISDVIIQRVGLRSLFHLTDIIHHLRDNDLPVCSGRKGYWWGTFQECHDVADDLSSRARQTLLAAAGLRRAAARVQAQNTNSQTTLNL